MKDWRRFTEHESIQLVYQPEITWDDGNDWEEDERRVAEAHETITAELAPKLATLPISADLPEDEGRATGGGESEAILYMVLAGMGAYVTLREVATDILKAIAYLREKAGDQGRVVIPEAAALLIAWDHVAPPQSHADASLEYIAPLSRVNPAGYSIAKGWIVGFSVDGAPLIVVISPDGEVLGTTPGFDVGIVPPLASGWESDMDG
jgi:hypothetical protein